MFRRRRKENPEPEQHALYVHLTQDGAIFVVRGNGTQAWITRRQLDGELQTLKSVGGTLLYSRDEPAGDPPPIAWETFQSIREHQLPIKLIDEPHPDVANSLPEGATYLMVFVYGGEDALVEDLLARGVELEARDTDGYTALMYAANRGHDGCVRLLLAHGANPNAADNQGSTPLMFAAQHGCTSIVKRLLDAGAELSARGDHGLTPLGFARQNGHTATASVLIQAGGRE